MLTMVVLSILLTINMLLMHFDKLVSFYYYMYRKLVSPKFKIGEFVMVDNYEYQVLLISKTSKPYTYFCLPTNHYNVRIPEAYFHETRIKKKTGLLKELE